MCEKLFPITRSTTMVNYDYIIHSSSNIACIRDERFDECRRRTKAVNSTATREVSKIFI